MHCMVTLISTYVRTGQWAWKKKKRLLHPLQVGQQRNRLRMWAWVPVSATTQVRAKNPRHDLYSDMRILRLGI